MFYRCFNNKGLMKMNKDRQSLITQEILEVVSVAEGMGGF